MFTFVVGRGSPAPQIANAERKGRKSDLLAHRCVLDCPYAR